MFKFERLVLAAGFMACIATSPARAQTYNFNFDDLPFLYDGPAAFPPVNFDGGAEVTTQDARSAPNSIMLYGNDNSATVSYGYFAPYNVNIPVTAATKLEYWVMPLWGGSYLAVDLRFNDGSYLRDSGAVDQFGVRVHPAFQGAGGFVPMNQYNKIESNIGEWAAGKTITQVIVGYDHPAATGWNNSVFDDIKIYEQTLPNCSTVSDCTATICASDCTESALRAAVEAANNCAAVPTFRRVITFASQCPGTVNLVNNVGTANGVAICDSGEVDDFFKQSICLEGHDITIDGANSTFNYAGSLPCDASKDSAGPAPFVLRGDRNTVRRATFQFFPEGIAIRTGDGHKADRITSQFYCDEMVTVGGIANGVPQTPTNASVTNGNFTGNTINSRCVMHPVALTCGFDKAVQLNRGTNTVVSGNLFTNASQPVKMSLGTATISGNTANGTAPGVGSNPDDKCQSITVSGGTATITNNVMTNCKFGIRASEQGIVDAQNNTLKDCYLSAFSVRDTGKLKGSGNRIKNCGFFTGSSCQRGGVAAWNSSLAKVDFGGGDCTGTAVVNGLSGGGNTFCQGTLRDFWNQTWSTPATCGGTSSTACMRGRSNCFDNGATVFPAGSVDTTGATTGCNCNF